MPAADVEALLREVAALTDAQAGLEQDHQAALEERALRQQTPKLLAVAAARYSEEVAAHDEVCAGRDWAEPPYRHC